MTTHQQKQSLEKWMKWEQRGIPSSHWTTALGDQWYFVALLAIALFHFILSAVIPLTEDELYYWSWAQKLQWSYFDHPPMVALFIKVSTAIFGNSAFGVRFFSTLTHFIIFLVLGGLTPGKQILGLLLLTPLNLYGAILLTPDVPFLLFWTLYLYWLISINRSFSQWGDDPVSRVYRSTPVLFRQWFIGGMILGFGLLSKYSMVLAIPCSFLVFFTRHRMRSWIAGFTLHGFFAAIIALPILYFNFKHQFVPFKFQWNHALNDSGGVFLDFLGSQSLLLGALPLLMFGWVLIRMKDLCTDSVYQVCFYFFAFPFLFSLFQSAKAHTEANWALMSYIGFWPIAQHLLNQNSFRLLGRIMVSLGFGAPLLVSLALLVHLVKPLNILPPQKDRIAKAASLSQLAQEIKKDLETNARSETLFLTTYQMTAQFRYLNVPSEQLHPLGRGSNFTLNPATPCSENRVLFLSESLELPENLRCFPNSELLRSYPLRIRNKTLVTYYLIEYSK